MRAQFTYADKQSFRKQFIESFSQVYHFKQQIK